MGKSIIQNKVIQEIMLVPEHKLPEIYEFIHFQRIS